MRLTSDANRLPTVTGSVMSTVKARTRPRWSARQEGSAAVGSFAFSALQPLGIGRLWFGGNFVSNGIGRHRGNGLMVLPQCQIPRGGPRRASHLLSMKATASGHNDRCEITLKREFIFKADLVSLAT